MQAQSSFPSWVARLSQPLQGVFGYALALSAGGAWVFEKVWRE